MVKGVITKLGDKPKEENIRRANIKKITIDPRLNIVELLELLYKAEERDEIEVLRIVFDSKSFTKDLSKTVVGKIRYVSSEFFMKVPLQTVKFGEEYSIEQLLKDMTKLDKYLINEYSAYTIENLYPVSITILDRGKEKIIKFGKVRQIDKQSQIGQMLRGGQIMPLDAVDLHHGVYNKELLWVSRGRPPRIEKEIKSYLKGNYIINASDIRQFTDHLHPHTEEHDGQHCKFTVITTCPVIIKERNVKIISVDEEEGSCEMIFPISTEEEN